MVICMTRMMTLNLSICCFCLQKLWKRNCTKYECFMFCHIHSIEWPVSKSVRILFHGMFCVGTVLKESHLTLTGLQQTQSLHCGSGASEVDVRGLLADGVGTEHEHHRHDHKPGGERKSVYFLFFF